jgi:rhodanese-related sulfurtransferase
LVVAQAGEDGAHRDEGRIVSRMTIDELLARARRRLARVNVDDALAAIRDGAVMVDIRSDVERARDGLIPGAIFHPRNVLEWRCDASSGYDDPRLSGDLVRRIVLICNEGYQSSLAAATLQDLGFARATDLVGGFQAWAAAGLPVIREAVRSGHNEPGRGRSATG